jgi:hypothetical protein
MTENEVGNGCHFLGKIVTVISIRANFFDVKFTDTKASNLGTT